jgi:hypothetical protein
MLPWLATVEDIPALVEMGAKFHAMSPHKFMGDYDPQATARMVAFMIDSPQAVLMTNGEGVIGGTYAPVYFAPSTWMIEENFWWAGKDGFALLEAMLIHAKGWGAAFCLLSTLENEHSKAIDRLLTRKGFRLMERRYIKEIA